MVHACLLAFSELGHKGILEVWSTCGLEVVRELVRQGLAPAVVLILSGAHALRPEQTEEAGILGS